MSEATQLKQHRQQFPGLSNKAYFNFGGQGPLPNSALAAITSAYERVQQQGPFSGQINAWITQKVTQTRVAIAQELGVAPETITLTENVTAGCNIALWGIDWQAGDRILMTDCEHPGVIAITQELTRRFGVEVSTCPIQNTLNEGDPVEVIAQHLQPRTRLVILSHLLWNTGQVLPLADIVAVCHRYEHGAVQVLVDAAQSVGSLPLNLSELEVDFYAFTGHKWWCGPAGVGGLYVHPDALHRLNPTYIGWRGITMNQTGKPTGFKDDGQRFEVATSAYPLYEGLHSAIATHQKWGTSQERYRQICQLSEYLWQSLSLEGIHRLKASSPQAGLVSFQVTGHHHKKLVQSLEEQGFFLRTLADPDCIRACVHYLTLPSEIEQLVAALKKLL